MDKIFDFHFHFLFKHYISEGISIDEEVKTKGFTSILDEIFGGPFDSQSSPRQVAESPLFLGVVALLSIEHAYANRMLKIMGIDFSKGLPINKKLVEDTKEGNTSYYKEFKKQIDFYQSARADLQNTYNIQFLNRADFKGLTIGEITEKLTVTGARSITFSIEGGHNLSDVPIRRMIPSSFPELKLKELQDDNSFDFMSINLSHLSDIPEQRLCGFAQGVNKTSQIAFHSEDFKPGFGLGITELGKKVIRQALTHERPILIDVKHMSVYSRFHFYRLREQMIEKEETLERLPIICSHSGFTFTSLESYLHKKEFKSTINSSNGNINCTVASRNKKIGKTGDLLNGGLFCNPWTINLFDEEIVEIMLSKGMIGIILDQRVLGTSNPIIDSARDRYFEKEFISHPEWERLFRDGVLPTAESLDLTEGLTPPKPERHIMLFCLHIIHAIRVGYKHLNWVEDTSPWDCICLGSDFDGLINPINGCENVIELKKLPQLLRKYLPQADKYLKDSDNSKSLKYTSGGRIDSDELERCIQKFLFTNGLQFTARFLTNWSA